MNFFQSVIFQFLLFQSFFNSAYSFYYLPLLPSLRNFHKDLVKPNKSFYLEKDIFFEDIVFRFSMYTKNVDSNNRISFPSYIEFFRRLEFISRIFPRQTMEIEKCTCKENKFALCWKLECKMINFIIRGKSEYMMKKQLINEHHISIEEIIFYENKKKPFYIHPSMMRPIKIKIN